MKLPDFRNTAKPLCLRWAKPHADIFRCTAEAFAAPKTQGLIFFLGCWAILPTSVDCRAYR